MRKQTSNSFNEGMIKDLNPLNTPNNVLTDALNATFITYNGNEFVLQNDMGNTIVERAKLSVGFIPIGMQEYGGIVYIASYNPETGEGELGSFPSPERDFSTRDFENLSPAKFKTSDYLVNTGGPIVNEKTSVLKKLVEPELLQLNPGDMFLVTYKINTPPAGTGTPITNTASMNSFITSDIADRKLFKLRFYKVSDDNNLNEIDADDIKLIDAADDPEDQYVYFKEKNKGTIAIGLELESLDTFDINVIDTSKRTDEFKSAAIEAIGFSDSLADFQGVKVEITEPEANTFYIDKTVDVKKVSAKITDLEADTKFIGSITPYSQYALYPKLKRDFNLELGKYASSGSDINNIFRYYTGTDYIKVDFDFKFEGNNNNGLTLYVEFYDPWSDYSVIKVVDNPTFFGINSVVMELIDEPVTDIFNSTQAGGTNKNLLIPNTDTDYLKTLLNTSGLIRTNTSLRKNHFYIVRISGVDIDITTTPIEYTHYDLYKGMYSNTMFNDVYNIQNSIPETSPLYVADFNSLDFDLSKVKYNVAVNEITNINTPPVITQQREDLMTNGKYYKTSYTVLSKTPSYKHTRTFKNNKNYSLMLSLTGTDKVFGTFKEQLLTVTLPTLGDSNSVVPLKPTIEDQNYDGDTNISPESYAKWNFNTISPKNYQLLTETTTKRSVYADVIDTPIVGLTHGIDYKEVSMADQLFYPKLNLGPFSGNRSASMQYDKYKVRILKRNGSIYDRVVSGRACDDDDIISAINDSVMTEGTVSALILTSQEPTWFYDPPAYHACASADPNGTAWWKQEMMYIRTHSATWRGTRFHNTASIIDFWQNLYVASSREKPINLYYPTQDIKANSQIATMVNYPSFNITTNFTPTVPATKEYLSTIMFKAISNVRVEFTTANINNYILTRLSDSIIINNKKEVRDGFIPYINSTKQSVEAVAINPITINQSADNSIVAKMAAGQSQISSDSNFSAGTYPHGKLFTKNAIYQSLTNQFRVNVVGGEDQEITTTNTYITVSDGGTWVGHNSRVGRCDAGDHGPDLLPNITF